MSETTLEKAQEIKSQKYQTLCAGVPLRYHPVIVVGPNEGFIVMRLGEAQKNGFQIVR